MIFVQHTIGKQVWLLNVVTYLQGSIFSPDTYSFAFINIAQLVFIINFRYLYRISISNIYMNYESFVSFFTPVRFFWNCSQRSWVQVQRNTYRCVLKKIFIMQSDTSKQHFQFYSYLKNSPLWLSIYIFQLIHNRKRSSFVIWVTSYRFTYSFFETVITCCSVIWRTSSMRFRSTCWTRCTLFYYQSTVITLKS